MTIKLGDYTLIHSGLIIQIENLPISITLKDDIEGDYTFIFNFTKEKDKEISTLIRSEDTHTMKIDLINFDHSQIGGNTEIIDVGTLGTKPLFLNYRVFDLANCSKNFQFNFYIKEN